MRRPALVALTLLAAGCQPPPPFSDSAAACDAETPTPTIRMTFPSSSESLAYCSTFPIVVATENFTFSPDHIEGALVEAEGHYHLYDGDTYLFTGATEWTILPESLALSAGRHALRLELAGNDHQELGISWITEITVDDTATDEGGAPSCIGGGTGSGPIY